MWLRPALLPLHHVPRTNARGHLLGLQDMLSYYGGTEVTHWAGPSMKCGECKKIKRCKGRPERGEGGKVVLVYYCEPCTKEIVALEKEAEDGTEGG